MEHQVHDQGRRAFLRRSAGIAGGVVIAAGVMPFAGCEEVTEKHPVAPLPAEGIHIVGTTLRIDSSADGFTTLAAPNGYVLVSGLNGLPERILVIRISATAVSAFSQVCPHQGCNVSPGQKGTIPGDRIECPCHGSVFLIESGAVVQGPATGGLKRYAASISGAIISVELA